MNRYWAVPCSKDTTAVVLSTVFRTHRSALFYWKPGTIKEGKIVHTIKNHSPLVWVTFLLLWQNTMTKATRKRKHLTAAPCSRRLESRAAWQGARQQGDRMALEQQLWASVGSTRKRQRELAGMKPQHLGPGSHPLQQGPVSWSFPNSSANGQPSIQTQTCEGQSHLNHHTHFALEPCCFGC